MPINIIISVFERNFNFVLLIFTLVCLFVAL